MFIFHFFAFKLIFNEGTDASDILLYAHNRIKLNYIKLSQLLIDMMQRREREKQTQVELATNQNYTFTGVSFLLRILHTIYIHINIIYLRAPFASIKRVANDY